MKPKKDGSIDATMDFELCVTEVSEGGVTLRSSHLMPKGTPIRIEGGVIEEIFPERPILVSVRSCENEPGSDSYLIDCEFDQFDDQLMRSVRVWLGLESEESLTENDL